MSKFIHGTEINLRLEELIKNADNYLWFISPYIRLHEKIKDQLSRKKHLHALQIVVVFGKNEHDPTKSISNSDLDFFMQFPNVKICYEKNLHAKYYASEDFSMITSMNLHEFSHNHNKEAGIILRSRSTIKMLTDLVIEETDAGDAAKAHFDEIIKHSMVVFENVPDYGSGILGFGKKYKGSSVIINHIDGFFHSTALPKTRPQHTIITGYCIRTGVAIPFNPEKPLCNAAYKTWKQFSDKNYPERFCHYSGEPSNGENCFSKPILKKNWNNARKQISAKGSGY